MSSRDAATTLETPFSLAGRKVWIAGHRGMVGQALVRRLARENCELVTVDRATADLRRQAELEAWMDSTRPEVVFMAAATVGGILANDTRPAEFIYDNLTIAANVVESSRRFGVRKLLMLGSSCIYPRLAPQPMREDALLSGPLEPTNQWYAMAKISGIKLCQAYRRQYGLDFNSAMPTNLYGPGDNFDLRSSHVIPALMRKIHEGKQSSAEQVEIWGTGNPRREFMYVEDCADALVHLMQHYSGEEHVNVGTGLDISIRELSETVAKVVGYQGTFLYDSTKPDGMPRKLMNVDRLTSLGWRASTELGTGLEQTYRWYVEHLANSPSAAS